MRPERITQAKIKVARFCAFRERAPKEVKDKLLTYGLNEDQAETLLQELITENFLNVDRFVKAFCHDKTFFNKWGRYKVRNELRRHQIDEDSIEKGLSSIDEQQYLEMLQSLVKRKYDSLERQMDDYLRQRKTYDYIIRKGFEPDLARHQVKSYCHAANT
ncbi:MAG: RecX family transcriptional regulator [Cyclobacteriaceae bacterium]|nr:RecX family transcriptional regulator [Cyclobacteriaceae bacterium HetDA_MAG_MS6]